MKIRLVLVGLGVALLAAAGWGGFRLVRVATATTTTEIPTTRVKKGQVTITVAARGELQGGNSEMLTAPMVGGGEMSITDMKSAGSLVNEGDVVVQFDTTQQEYNLREAEADLAEAEQQVINAEATAAAAEEEARYTIISTAAEVKIAEQELRKNPIVEKIKARQNEIALEAAQNRAKQAIQDANNRKATTAASINIQKASQGKATVMATTAKRQIDSMTLKAKTGGYVNIQLNSNQNMIYYGMLLPPFQIGDTARAGMAVAQIPDLKNWEVSANVGELDRGHLTAGQKVMVGVVALSGKKFAGHVKSMGGTIGPPWDRKFECRMALDESGPELRPGMTSNMVITIDTLNDVLWVPSQALFERDGRSFVYLQTKGGFVPHDVTLVRRSESQAVLSGIKEGDLVAMSNPDQQHKPAAAGQNSALKALGK
jgi:HlyD family secretion protein